jgi:hypothetical protein
VSRGLVTQNGVRLLNLNSGEAPSLTAARVVALWQPDPMAEPSSHGTCSASTPRLIATGEKDHYF